MATTRKRTHIGKFNDIVDQLFDICEKYEHPEVQSSIQYYRYQIDLGRKANPRLVVETIVNPLAPFIDHIMTRDAAFFLSVDIHAVNSDTKEQTILDSLRDSWRHVDDEHTKDKIWKLLQLALMYGVLVTRDPVQLAAVNKHRVTPLVLD